MKEGTFDLKIMPRPNLKRGMKERDATFLITKIIFFQSVLVH